VAFKSQRTNVDCDFKVYDGRDVCLMLRLSGGYAANGNVV
jgi:hypothetical protein